MHRHTNPLCPWQMKEPYKAPTSSLTLPQPPVPANIAPVPKPPKKAILTPKQPKAGSHLSVRKNTALIRLSQISF